MGLPGHKHRCGGPHPDPRRLQHDAHGGAPERAVRGRVARDAPLREETGGRLGTAKIDPREIISRKGGKGGSGLFSIRERLQRLGGSLKVDSKFGQGTRVTLSGPLRHRLVKRG